MMKEMIVIGLLLVALVFICWKEFSRHNKSHLILRLAASVLALTALYFLAFPLTFAKKVDTELENSMIILTDGFKSDSLASLRGIPEFTTEKSISERNKNVKFLPDLAYFLQTNLGFSKIHIIGNGLEKNELELLKDHEIIFHPGKASGLTSASWNKNLRAGEQLIVQGSFNDLNGRTVKILLKGLSTTLDSVNVPGDKASTFKLTTTPKLLGKSVFSIVALSGTDTLANEIIPVFITAKQPLRVLMITSSPNFENKFLKNWLYAENASLSVRTSISKDKFSTEFLNTKKVNLNRLTLGILSGVDILIGDLSELSRMSAGENSAVQGEIAKGMGLVIRADSVGGTGFYRKAFNIRQDKALKDKAQTLVWSGRAVKKTVNPSSESTHIVQNPGEQSLVVDAQNRVLVSSKLYGSGKIILTTVPDTYTWVLSDNSALYSNYWSYLLEKAAKKSSSNESIGFATAFPSVNEDTQIKLEKSTDSIPQVSVNTIPVGMEQHGVESYRWTGTFWPTESGWVNLKSGNYSHPEYVFDRNAWKTVKSAQKLNSNSKFIRESGKPVKTATAIDKFYTYSIPAIYFFILFIVCCTYLWLEPKLL